MRRRTGSLAGFDPEVVCIGYSYGSIASLYKKGVTVRTLMHIRVKVIVITFPRLDPPLEAMKFLPFGTFANSDWFRDDPVCFARHARPI